MKTLKEINNQKIKWVRPLRDSQHGEIFTQLKQLSEHPKIEKFPHDVHHELMKLRDEKIYDESIKNGKVKKIKPNKTKNLKNHTSEKNAWKDLDDHKKQHVLKRFASGRVEMPIILRNKDTKEKWLLAGNTRLTYNSQIRKKKTPVVMINY